MEVIKEIKIFDNFLPQDLHEELVEQLVLSSNIPLYFSDYVSLKDRDDPLIDKNWNWYAFHQFYNQHKPTSDYYDRISQIFADRLIDLKSLIRIKLNFYPHTETMREHGQHRDFEFSHHAAIYSLNTCDGFTRLCDGSKVDSVANRMIFFDGSILHNSSTTTNAKGRYNINFNYL
jgi:hypothetical protein